MATAVMNMTTAALDWVSIAFDAPLARAVVFGVHIDGIICSILTLKLKLYTILIVTCF